MVDYFKISPGDRQRVDRLLARMDVAKAKARKAKLERARKLTVKRQRERRPERKRGLPTEMQTLYGIAGWKVMVARMEPGVWYTFGEIRAMMAEFPRGSVKAWLQQRAIERGYVVKAGNPDFDPNELVLRWPGSKTDGGSEGQGSGSGPLYGYGERYLYGLAEKSTHMRQEWLLALGIVAE